jgi:hypothetical protein
LNSSPSLKTEKIWKVIKDHTEVGQSCCFCNRIEEEKAVQDLSNVEMLNDVESVSNQDFDSSYASLSVGVSEDLS